MRRQPLQRASNGQEPLTGDPIPGLLLELCELADSPRSLAVYLAFKHGSYQDLVSFECNPNDYEPLYHRDSFELDHACVAMLSKYQDFDIPVDREQAAFQKWIVSEERCARTNQLFRDRWGNRPHSWWTHQAEEVYHLAKQKIRSWLKEVDYEHIRSQCRFGPGADLSTKGNNTSVYHKFSTDGSCTPGVVSLYDDIFSNEDADFRGEYPHNASYVDSSRLSFVPKTALVDRAICVEPRWNVYIQLGIGSLITKRLKRIGIDITDQTVNQSAAKRALVDRLATIDLSSASDSISKNLVLDMIDDDEWLELLFKSRCASTSYDGKVYYLEKLSSMGNGFTFPLQTMIFLALAFASVEVSGLKPLMRENLCVYGDDIVVPSASAPLLIEVLENLGFVPNKRKTYISGYFYESCGKDYWFGKDVRPFFVKKKVSSVIDGILLANQIARFSRISEAPTIFVLKSRWNLRSTVIRRIPKPIRLFGPPECGDGVIHSAFDTCRPRVAARDPKHFGWEGFLIDAYVAKPEPRLGFNWYGHLYSKLSADMDTGSRVFTRDRVSWRRTRVYVPTYTDIMLI